MPFATRSTANAPITMIATSVTPSIFIVCLPG
jgi:hypothetical protein